MAEIVSERYALSLYEVAKEEKKTAELLEELEAVTQVFADNPDLMKVLKTPSIQFSEKKDTLQNVFGGRIDPYLLNFLMLITEKRRIGLLPEMTEAYKQQYYFEEGICEVHATTAAPMSAELTEKLKAKMCSVTGKKVVLKTKVDPSILGGIVVKVDNKQIDTSVKTRLQAVSYTHLHSDRRHNQQTQQAEPPQCTVQKAFAQVDLCQKAAQTDHRHGGVHIAGQVDGGINHRRQLDRRQKQQDARNRGQQTGVCLLYTSHVRLSQTIPARRRHYRFDLSLPASAGTGHHLGRLSRRAGDFLHPELFLDGVSAAESFGHPPFPGHPV